MLRRHLAKKFAYEKVVMSKCTARRPDRSSHDKWLVELGWNAGW